MFRRALWLSCALLAYAPSARAHVRISLPADRATVLEASVTAEIAGCRPWFGGPGFESKIDGEPVALDWRPSAYPGRWLARLPELAPGEHALEVSGHCPLFRTSEAHSFTIASGAGLDTAIRLANHYVRSHSAAALSWDWGPAVLLYGLERLYDAMGRFPRYVHAYHAQWDRRGAPDPDRSDLCPPALTALALARDHQDAVGMGSALAVADYLRVEPRDSLGALNHLGHSWLSVFFPDSIWVDSLMMEALPAVHWGAYANEPELLEFGARQPLIYASVLQDPVTGLFRHAWKVNSRKPIPEDDTFWLRGNGWVLVSIAEIIDGLPPDSPEIPRLLEVFRKTAHGLLPYQLPTGLWDSLANLPGYTYPETSGTSLVAYALAKGAHRGWLGPEYLEAAKHAFSGVTAMLLPEDDGLTMPSISGSTNPGPRWLYTWVPHVKNASYGVGAYLLAATELKDEGFEP